MGQQRAKGKTFSWCFRDTKSKFCGQQHENEHKERVTRYVFSSSDRFVFHFFVCSTKELFYPTMAKLFKI